MKTEREFLKSTHEEITSKAPISNSSNKVECSTQAIQLVGVIPMKAVLIGILMNMLKRKKR